MHNSRCEPSQCPRSITYSVRIYSRARLLRSIVEPLVLMLQVCDDIRKTLRIDGCETFRSSINRPNLFYEVCSCISN